MSLFSETSAKWKLLLETGVWLATLIGGFVFLPPYLEPGEAAGITKFAQFLAASLAGLLLLPLTLFSGTRHLLWWWVLAIVLLGASTTTFLRYDALMRDSTVPYDTTRVVVGTEAEYRPEVAQRADSLRRARAPTSRTIMVADYVGQLELIWPEDVLRAHERRLLYAYLLTLGLFAAFIVVLAHVVTGVAGVARAGGKESEGGGPEH